MPFDPCNPCANCNIGHAALGTDTFKLAVLVALCSIASGSAAQQEAAYIYGEIAAATIPATFGPAPGVLITNTGDAQIMDIFNNTDKILEFSLDGTNVAFSIKAGVGKIYDLRAGGRSESSNLSVRYAVAGGAPTTGSVTGTFVI